MFLLCLLFIALGVATMYYNLSRISLLAPFTAHHFVVGI